jgi:hypothetical protein
MVLRTHFMGERVVCADYFVVCGRLRLRRADKHRNCSEETNDEQMAHVLLLRPGFEAASVWRDRPLRLNERVHRMFH